MVSNEGPDKGGKGNGEGELPEELQHLSREELEELAETMAEEMTEDDQQALDGVMWVLCQVEAAGSLKEAEELGALQAAPDEIVAMIRSMVPTSRGGEDASETSEKEWQAFVEDMIEANGSDFFDKVLAEMRGDDEVEGEDEDK